MTGTETRPRADHGGRRETAPEAQAPDQRAADHQAADQQAADQRAAERARAVTYLDLWERHLSHAAAYGPEPAAAPRRPRR